MRKKVVVIGMILILLMSFALTGCAGPSRASADTISPTNAETLADISTDKPVKLVILAFNGNNSARPDYTSENLTYWVSRCTASYGEVVVINVDGNSQVAIKDSFKIPEAYKTTTDPARLENDAKRRASAFMETLVDIAPDDSEVDYLDALHMGSRELAAAGDDAEKILIILGSGVSTTGTLNFQNNIITADPSLLADMLEEISAIPDLKGVTAIWMGLGDVAAPQKDLSYDQEDRLVAIWKEIITRGGAEFENPKDLSFEGSTDTTLPEVTAIDFPSVPLPDIEPSPDNEILDEMEPSIFNIEFIADSSEYLDESTTMELLAEVADYMNRHSEYSPIIAGACAGDEENDYVLKLSKDRAEAIKRSLIALGIDESRITTLGLGNVKDPYHVFGVGVESALASQNRRVIIVNQTSPEASKLFNN